MEFQVKTAREHSRNIAASVILGLLLLLYVIQGVFIAAITPYGEFPDEQSHFEYARFVRINKRLPPISLDGKNLMGESFQPPFYYIIAGILLRPSADQLSNIVILRLFSLLLGGLSVILLWKTVRLAVPNNFAAVSLSTGFAALNSQYIFIHAGVSNIAMATFTGASTIYLAVLVMKSRRPALFAALMGASFGAAMISRTTSVYLFPVCLLALYWKAKDAGAGSMRRFLNWTILFGLVSAAVSGSWYLRNWIYYGDPLLWHFHQDIIGPDFARREPLTFFYFLQSAAYLNASFWAYYGKHEFHAGIPEYAIYLLLETLALLGIKEALSPSRNPLFEMDRRAFLLILSGALFAVGTVLLIQAGIASPQGRYFFMAISPLAIMLGTGVTVIIPERFRIKISYAILFFLLIFSVYLLSTYWYPHYQGKTVADSIRSSLLN